MRFLVFLLYTMRRVDCRRCGAVAVEEVPWADSKRTLTKAYMLFLARRARRLSWKETAEAFRTSWDKVFDAIEHVVTWGLQLVIQHYDLWTRSTFPAILTLVGDTAAFGRQCGVAYQKLENNSIANLAERANTLAGQADAASGIANRFLTAIGADEPAIKANFDLSLRRWNWRGCGSQKRL